MDKVRKPWGIEWIWAATERYAGKILKIRKGKRLSLQYHESKDESVYVLKGRLQIQIGPAIAIMKPGMAMDIPAGVVHRFEAPFGPVELIEVSAGPLDDVKRLEDDYGRVGQ